MKRWLFLILFFAAACNPAEENPQKVRREYFDIKGLLDKQIELLDSIGPSLHKIAVIDGVRDTITYTPGSSGWRKELEIFDEADLNKPRLKGLYEISEKKSPESYEIIYASKDPHSTPIDSLFVSVKTADKKSMKIHVLFHAGNFFYSSSQRLELDFTDMNGQLFLKSFDIQGWQKLILRDTTLYHIEASVKWP